MHKRIATGDLFENEAQRKIDEVLEQMPLPRNQSLKDYVRAMAGAELDDEEVDNIIAHMIQYIFENTQLDKSMVKRLVDYHFSERNVGDLSTEYLRKLKEGEIQLDEGPMPVLGPNPIIGSLNKIATKLTNS
jgi:hypothetical protein